MDLKRLNLDELVGVVNLYPWFGGARRELCERMSRMGKDAWGMEQYADAAMYVGSRAKLSSMLRAASSQDWSDADVEDLIKSYLEEKQEAEAAGKRKV